MIRNVLATFAIVITASITQAASFACTSPLVVPSDITALPQPGLRFTLVLQDAQNFVGDGRRFENDTLKPFQWRGQWTRYDDQVAMIGTTGLGEWRAFSSHASDGVLMLELKTAKTKPLMIRCLAKEAT